LGIDFIPIEMSNPYSLRSKLDNWKETFKNHPNKDWLINLIAEGLRITEGVPPHLLKPIQCQNYKSLELDYQEAQKGIFQEAKIGRTVPVNHIPFRINAIGLVPKKDTKEMRRITDLSRPIGNSINELIPDHPFKFQNIKDAFKIIQRNWWMISLDLRTAYRWIPIHPDDWDIQSFLFEGKYYQDRFLSFGLKIAPFVFQKITSSIQDILTQMGLLVITYLDEFLIIAPDYQTCLKQTRIAIQLLQNLGFVLNHKKALLPTQIIPFLGFILNSIKMEVSIDKERIQKLKTTLNSIINKEPLLIHNMKSIVGKLQFAAQVVFGGRTFLRRCHSSIALQTRLFKTTYHKMFLSKPLIQDALWWYRYIEIWNGKAISMNFPFLTTYFATDASNQIAAGVLGLQGIYYVFQTKEIPIHKAIKELLAVYLSVDYWKNRLTGHEIEILSDNEILVICSWINSATAINSMAMIILRNLFWILAINQIRISNQYIPPKINYLADAIIRRLWELLPPHMEIIKLSHLPSFKND